MGLLERCDHFRVTLRLSECCRAVCNCQQRARALSCNFAFLVVQGMRNKDKAGLTTRGSQGDDYN